MAYSNAKLQHDLGSSQRRLWWHPAVPEGHRVSPFAKALWIKLYIRRAVPLFIGKSKKLKHFVGKRKSDEI